MEKTTKIGVIGVGGRGINLFDILLGMDDVKIVSVCDFSDELLKTACEHAQERRGYEVKTTKNADELINDPDVEAVMIFTSWNAHVPLAIKAMKAGKYVAFEVGPAQNIEQVWELVRTSEETGAHCMMLENCCYGERELMMDNMIDKGMFGELIHCRAGYGHDLREHISHCLDRGQERGYQNVCRNGDIYITHGLGPVMNWLKINRGNRFLTVSSVSSKAVGLQKKYEELHEGKTQRFNMGDITTTTLTCAGGETALITHNISSPRPYTRYNWVQGTKGIYTEDNDKIYIEGHGENDKWSEVGDFAEYAHPIWKKKNEFEALGHGGMDYLVLRAFLEAVRNGTKTPIDVYDSAVLLAISVLSETS
ncbi:MAG: Gfo/Idh/MocA family oxidoreductase, partial [Firmicutes bacterium]|nr:Gfo/Idh/MocA family oxidoreductase [Candidatus Colimorpha enterica]